MKIVALEKREKVVGLKEYIKDNILVFDGAMGTMLQKTGLKLGENPEVLNYNWEGICVAFLHDCIEDADYPEEVEQYILKNFSDKIYEAVKLLTHNRLEKSYDEYIETIMTSGNEIAIAVKYADSLDNSVPTSNMDEKWIERCRKYRKNSDIYLECLQQTKKNNSLLKGN